MLQPELVSLLSQLLSVTEVIELGLTTLNVSFMSHCQVIYISAAESEPIFNLVLLQSIVHTAATVVVEA